MSYSLINSSPWMIELNIQDSSSNQIAIKKRIGIGCQQNWNPELTIGAIDGSQDLAVLEAIPVYWMALAWIPKSIMNKTKRICTTFLWLGKKYQKVPPWVKCDQIARPKSMGGWGIKNTFFFAKALVEKIGWRLISTQSPWTKVIIHKHIL